MTGPVTMESGDQALAIEEIKPVFGARLRAADELTRRGRVLPRLRPLPRGVPPRWLISYRRLSRLREFHSPGFFDYLKPL